MSFNKTGIIDFGTMNELTSAIKMKTKTLDDGSVWGRINWLDLTNGSAPCFASATEVNECDLSNRFSLMGYVDAFKSPQLLPAGYTRIEYIQSTGAQMIDTGYAWQSEVVEIIFDGTVINNSSSQSLFGNEEYIDASNNRYFSIVPHGANGTYSWYVGGNGPLVRNVATLTLNERFTMICKTTENKNFKTIVNNVEKVNATYTGSIMASKYCLREGSVTNVGNIFILGNHNSSKATTANSAPQNVSGMRVYGFKMYDNKVLIRDFVPCRYGSTNGLYDLVEGKYYTSTNGANFTAGGDISGGAYEFMLTYPSMGNQYNRWRQTSSPNAAYGAGTHYEPIHIDLTSVDNYIGGPLTKVYSGSAVYACNKSKNWWAPIGQTARHQNGIPAGDGSIQTITELWVRLDTLSQASSQQIISPNFYTTLGQENIARVMKYNELQSAEFIEI